MAAAPAYSGLNDSFEVASYMPLYPEESDLLRQRRASGNSSASREGSLSVNSARSSKELFNSALFVKAPNENRSKYEKLIDIEDDKILSKTETSETKDDDSIGSASDLCVRVDSSDEEGSSGASTDSETHCQVGENDNTCKMVLPGTTKPKSDSQNILQDVFIGHLDGDKPLLEDDELSDLDQKHAKQKLASKTDHRFTEYDTSDDHDVFSAAPFHKKLLDNSLYKTPLIQSDVFDQAPFRKPSEKPSSAHKIHFKKKVQSTVSVPPTCVPADTNVIKEVAPTNIPEVGISKPKVSEKIYLSDMKGLDLFGSSQSFHSISEHPLISAQVPGPTSSARCPPPFVTEKPSSLSNATSSSDSVSQDLFGAVPFSNFSNYLPPKNFSQSEIFQCDSVSGKPKVPSVSGTSIQNMDQPQHSNNGNNRQNSLDSPSSDSSQESMIQPLKGFSKKDKNKYQQFMSEDLVAHDVNVNVVTSRQYTQLKPAKKGKQSKKKDLKEKVSSNAFANMSFEDGASDEDSVRSTKSIFINDPSAVNTTDKSANVLRTGKLQ